MALACVVWVYVHCLYLMDNWYCHDYSQYWTSTGCVDQFYMGTGRFNRRMGVDSSSHLQETRQKTLW